MPAPARLPGLPGLRMRDPLTGQSSAIHNSTVGDLGVIGNISRDVAAYPGGRAAEILGGAALHLALAASRAGLRAAPVSVIGPDLRWITNDPRLTGLDLSFIKVVRRRSCTFRLTYDRTGQLIGTGASFGAAEMLTSHALDSLSSRPTWHVCCRRPLDVGLILGRLAGTGTPFSADFHLASARRLISAARAALPHATAVFVNKAELAILSQVIDPGKLKLIVVSDGPRPATVLQYGRPAASAEPPSVAVAEVTGAGDTLAGTFLAAAAQGLDDADALRTAVNAASQAVGTPGLTIPPERGLA